MQFDENIQNSWKSEFELEKSLWVNYQAEEDVTHSLLLYRKGNHSAFSNLFDIHYSSYSNRSFAPEGNVNWFIPYKDPVDKILGGYLSSEWWAQEKHKKKFKGKTNDYYNDLEPYLLNVVDEILKGDFAKSPIYDMHMTPLSITLENALTNRPKFLLSRLVGLNLDTRRDIWSGVYRPIIQRQDNITEELLQLFVNRRSPYSDRQKYYISKFKHIHTHKIRDLVHGPLYNEYKLVNFFEHHMYYKNKIYNG